MGFGAVLMNGDIFYFSSFQCIRVVGAIDDTDAFCISRNFPGMGCGVQSVTMAGTSTRRTLCANSSDTLTPSDKPATPTSENPSKVKSVSSLIYILPPANRRCGKVMFSQKSVCSQGVVGMSGTSNVLLGSGYACPRSILGTWGLTPLATPPPPRYTSLGMYTFQEGTPSRR